MISKLLHANKNKYKSLRLGNMQIYLFMAFEDNFDCFEFFLVFNSAHLVNNAQD